MSDIEYEEFNDMKLAKIYDSFNGLDEDETFWLQQIDKVKPKIVIDFGCGTGLLTLKIAEKGYKTTGIDLAKPMLDLARQKPLSGAVNWKLGSIEQIEGKADLIIMTSHVAQFFVDDREWSELLLQAYNSLSKGGHILFDTKNPNMSPWDNWTKEKSLHEISTQDGVVEMWTQLLELGENTTIHKHHYTSKSTGEELTASTTLIYRRKQEIVDDLEKAGFIIEDIYGDFYGNEYKEDASKEMIFLAKKV